MIKDLFDKEMNAIIKSYKKYCIKKHGYREGKRRFKNLGFSPKIGMRLSSILILNELEERSISEEEYLKNPKIFSSIRRSVRSQIRNRIRTDKAIKRAKTKTAKVV